MCRAERMPEIIDRRFVWKKTVVCKEKVAVEQWTGKTGPGTAANIFADAQSISCISFLKRILVLACKARYAVALLFFANLIAQLTRKMVRGFL